jgi:hypothetical protein
MSSNLKFWHVCVLEGYKTILARRCLSVQEANELLKEMKEKYPSPQYAVSKELYA